MAASPTDGFFSQVGMFRLSLNSLGEMYKKADIVLSLGDKKIIAVPDRWVNYLSEGIKIHWADPLQFQKIGQLAQGNNKWKYDYGAYDLIILCDADIILIKPLDELLLLAREKNAVTGVIAHYPFPHHEDEKPDALWHFFANKFTGKDIQLNYRYTLLKTNDQDENTKCPFYLNFGFVAMTPEVFNTIRETYLDIRSDIVPLLKTPVFSGQIALTLAIHKHNIPTQSAEMKYNFPNDPIAEELYPDQLKEISIIHYLRTQKFDRQKIFATEKAFNKFLLLELEGSNKIFQEYIRSITHGRYPFKYNTSYLKNALSLLGNVLRNRRAP